MKKNFLSLAAILLVILGIFMIFLGMRTGILPPTITGVGFVIIAFAFFSMR